MLGRLRMTLEACEDAYLKLSKKIFTPRSGNILMQKMDFLNANGKFDEKVLENAIKECIKIKFPEMSPENVLLKDPDPSCKTYALHRASLIPSVRSELTLLVSPVLLLLYARMTPNLLS